MPVVLTDFTNRVWATEQPNDGYLHVGWTGRGGPRLVEVLEFVTSRQKQFDQFIARKREQERKPSGKPGRKKRAILQSDHARIPED